MANKRLKKLQSVQRIKQGAIYLCIFMLITLLVACNKESDLGQDAIAGNHDLNRDLQSRQVVDVETEIIPLSQDITALITDKSAHLSIQQHKGAFLPASSPFSQRIIGLLALHDEALVKAANSGQHDLVFRFAGFADIHLNIETNTFWFAGADHAYPLQHSFSDQWERYIIRVVDGELMYDSFEKTILQKSFFVGEDEQNNSVSLYYDGDIRLLINDMDIVIASNVRENTLDYIDSNHPQGSYSINMLGDKPLIAVSYHFPTVHGTNTKLDIFNYGKDHIHRVFSTADWDIEIETIDYEKGEISIGLPFADSPITYRLTDKEKARTNEKLQQFETNNVIIDDEYIKRIKDGISYHPTGVDFRQTEQGHTEVLISTQIESIGAKVPVSMNMKAVFIFEVDYNRLHYIKKLIQ